MFEKIKEMLRSKDPEMKTLGEALKKEQELRDNLNLPLVKLLQEQNPNLIVCGSTAMYLQGVRLKRWSHSKSDLDIVIPFYFKYVSREWLVVGNDCIKKYGNDFDYTIQMDGITVDVRIDNKMSYNLVTLDEVTYKVCRIEDILIAKLKYGLEGNRKHTNDVYEMIDIKSPYLPIDIPVSDIEEIFNTTGS